MFSLLQISTTLSQEIVNTTGYYQLDVEAGLPSNESYHVIQDRQGFLWFATDNGLVKYDGKNMKYFNMTHGLTDNVIFKLFEDEHGRIWCATYNSQICYITPDDKVHSYKYNYKINNWKKSFSLGKPVIISFSIESDVLRIGYRYGSGITIDTNGRLTSFADSDENSITISHRSSSIQIKSSDFKTDKNFIEKGAKKIQLKDLIGREKVSRFRAHVPSVEYIGKQRICFSWSNMVVMLDHEMQTSVYECSGEVVKLDYIDSILWVSQFNNGVVGYLVRNSKLIPKYHFFENLSITSVCKDQNDGFWFSSLENGIIFLLNINYRSIKVTGDESNILRALTLNDDIFVRDNDNIIRKYDQNLKLKGKYNLSGESIMTLYPSIEGKNNTNIQYSTLTNEYTYDLAQDAFTCSETVHAPSILTYFYQNLKLKFCREKLKITNLTSGKSTVQETPTINSVVVNGELVITYLSDKLFLYKILNGKFKLLQTRTLEEGVQTIKVYNDQFYCVTRSGALYCLDSELDLKLIYQTPENIIVNDFIITDKNLWIASNQGLFKGEFVTNKIMRYWRGAVKQLFIQNTRLTFCTSKSIHSFQDFDIIDQSVIKIDKVLVNGIQTSKRQFNNGNNIEFKFQSIGAIPGRNSSFECVLVGDDTTRIVTSSREIQFPSLTPGLYRFFIINQANGRRSEIIEFEILTPFWRRTWVIISILALSILILIVVGVLISRQREKKLKLQTQLVELKSQALRAQMNPHFIFNSMNVVQSLISSNNFDRASSSIVKLSRLIRNTLNYSQETTVSLKDEVAFTKNYFDLENLRMNDSMTLTVENSQAVDLESIQIPPICIQPLVENAIIHGVLPSQEKGQITVSFEQTDELFIVTIANNGIKFMPERSKSDSKGLELIRNRIKLLHRKNELVLPVDSSQEELTIIKIKLHQ